MNELEKIADQLTRAMEGEAWHGPALLELLKDITAAQSSAYPIKNVHSIWEIVNHIIAEQKATEQRLNFKEAELSGEEDWPPVKNNSDFLWQKTIDELNASFNSLKEKILSFPIDKLEEKVPAKENQTFYILLHGIIQHNIYHAGQIAIIKKSILKL